MRIIRIENQTGKERPRKSRPTLKQRLIRSSVLLCTICLMLGVWISWLSRIVNHAQKLVAGAYQSGRLTPDLAWSKSRAAWDEAIRFYGPPTHWQVESAGVQGLGTPASLTARTTRRGSQFKEHWGISRGKVYHYSLVEVPPPPDRQSPRTFDGDLVRPWKSPQHLEK